MASGGRREGGNYRQEEDELQEENEEDEEENHDDGHELDTGDAGKETGKKSVEEDPNMEMNTMEDKQESGAHNKQ